MSNQDTLEKAIQKAINGGYELPRKKWEVTPDLYVKLLTDKDYGNAVIADYQSLIFNHDFAKALWNTPRFTNINELHFETRDGLSEWQYNLQQMVIADDPIAYLAQNI